MAGPHDTAGARKHNGGPARHRPGAGPQPGAVQASLIVFFVALGLGQVVYGPVSDMAGRKAPLHFGLTVLTLRR